MRFEVMGHLLICLRRTLDIYIFLVGIISYSSFGILSLEDKVLC